MFTEYLRQLSRVDACDAWHLFALEPGAETFNGIPVAVCLAVITHDDGRGINFVAFHKGGQFVVSNRERRNTIVADQGIGKRHQLSCV